MHLDILCCTGTPLWSCVTHWQTDDYFRDVKKERQECNIKGRFTLKGIKKEPFCRGDFT